MQLKSFQPTARPSKQAVADEAPNCLSKTPSQSAHFRGQNQSACPHMKRFNREWCGSWRDFEVASKSMWQTVEVKSRPSNQVPLAPFRLHDKAFQNITQKPTTPSCGPRTQEVADVAVFLSCRLEMRALEVARTFGNQRISGFAPPAGGLRETPSAKALGAHVFPCLDLGQFISKQFKNSGFPAIPGIGPVCDKL